MNLKRIILFAILLLSINSNCQYYKLSENAKISVITCGSGNQLYSIYGHSAIRIEDLSNDIDLVYNYGYFDFNTPNFYLKFVKGDMQYFGAADKYQSFIVEYIATNRTVFEQELLISDEQKQQLFDNLNASLFSDQRFYTYKFIDKNCTTMVLDKVNGIYNSQIVTKKVTNDDSYRTVLYKYLDNHFWENFGINIIFGQKVDANATKLFLPNELMENLKTTRLNGKPIVKKAVVLNQKKAETEIISFWNSFYPYLIFLTILVLINRKSVYLIYFLILGLLGVFFSLVGFYSYHEEIWWNYNVLLFNPTLLILAYLKLKQNNKWFLRLIYFNLTSLSIYTILIINKIDFLMLLPMVIVSSIILIKFRQNIIDRDKTKL